MGVDVTCYMGIGVKIDSKKLYTPTKVKAFNHNYNLDCGMEFCPKTGKKLWEIESVPNESLSNLEQIGYTIRYFNCKKCYALPSVRNGCWNNANTSFCI